jgi:hypothetical protein
MGTDPPHRGEMHPDGDELLYLVSGSVEIVLEDDDREERGRPSWSLAASGTASRSVSRAIFST